MHRLVFENVPLWAVFIITVVVVLVSVGAGLLLGRRRRARSEHGQDAPVGAVVGAILGLLAFMLAFTFSMTATRFDTRKQLLLDEVNAIGTAFLRAGLLPEPHQNETRKLLREYVDLRVDLTRHPEKIDQVLARSAALQDELWSHARALAQADRGSPIYALFIDSLNEMFDIQTKRVTVGLLYRIPPTIWLALYFVSVLAMGGVGYQFGLASSGSIAINLALALTFSAVILLIADLDRAGEGALRVDQQPMFELQQQLSGAR